MSGRDLVVLGTSSQAPTRTRNHNGYLLRWDGEGVLFDPGEGTQRQLIHADVPSTRITRVCLTHLHGDHCLGLPGVLARMALDQVEGPVPLHYPETGQRWVDHLCDASIGRGCPVRPEPVALAGEPHVVTGGPPLRITARALDHRVDAVGYRVEEPDTVRFLPNRLAAAGVHGPDVGALRDQGHLLVDGRRVTLAEVTEPRRGHAVAVVMDTRVCDNAVALAEGVDLLLCEATFTSDDEDLARDYGHLTARDAATIAREAGARLLVLTHFSARYPSLDAHRREAEAVFPAVVVADDLQVVELPHRDAPDVPG